MALGELRRIARIQAIGTVSEYARSMGEEGSSHEDRDITEEEHDLFIDECKKLHLFLDKKAKKLITR
jgi:hypothetical protein